MLPPHRTAHTFWSRLKGRLGESASNQPLLIPKCNAVHTIGMKFPLHLTWFDQKGAVIKEQLAVANKFYFCAGAHSVLESHLDETNLPSLRTDTSGQALVEAAFTIPILLIIILGFIQIGLIVNQAQKLTYVTHYATQIGAITNDPQKISGAIEEFFETSDFTLSLESRDHAHNLINDNLRQYNDILTVQVTAPFALQIPLVSISVLDLQAKASARILCPSKTSPYICNN